MKPHPETMILIETDAAGLWRIVARATTSRGLAAGPMPSVIDGTYENIAQARDQLRWMKRKPKGVGL